MKQTSQEVLAIIDGDILKRRNEFLAIAETIGIASSPVGDESFSNLITSTNWALDLIKEAINKGLIDSLSASTRTTLKIKIGSLNNCANDLLLTKTITDSTSFISAANLILDFVEQNSIELYLKTLPDYKQKLSEVKQLREKLIKLNSDSIKANDTLLKSEGLLATLSDKYSQNDKAQADFNANVDNAKALYLQLEESKKNIQERITEIETFYNDKFKLLNEAILKSDTGLEATINFATEKFIGIKGLAENANTSFTALTNSVAEYEKILKNLVSTNNSIQELFTKVNDPEQGIDKKFNAFSETKAKIDELYSKSTESFKIISDLEIKIDSIFKDSTIKLKSITDAKEKSEATLADIKKIYGITADIGMGGEFDKLARNSANDFKDWGSKIRNTTIILFISILFIFLIPFIFCPDTKICNINLSPDILLRLTITSPLIFYLVFCTTQYRRAKENYYEYSYKATLALSIKNHINLLVENPLFQKDNYTKSILKFAIKGLDKIYSEPFFNKSMEHKFKIMEDKIKYGPNNKTDSKPPPETKPV